METRRFALLQLLLELSLLLLELPGPQLPSGTWPLPLLEALPGANKNLLSPPCLPISHQYLLLAKSNGKPAGKGAWEM